MTKVFGFFIEMLEGFQPYLILMLRLYLSFIFWGSGLLKISNWQGTIYLFQHEYKTPFLSPHLAAITGTGIELICPILLVLGLAGRFAAIGIFATTLLIELTYQHSDTHILWMMIAAVLICFGMGRFSYDYYIKKKYFPELEEEETSIFSNIVAVILILLTVIVIEEIARGVAPIFL